MSGYERHDVSWILGQASSIVQGTSRRWKIFTIPESEARR